MDIILRTSRSRCDASRLVRADVLAVVCALLEAAAVLSASSLGRLRRGGVLPASDVARAAAFLEHVVYPHLSEGRTLDRHLVVHRSTAATRGSLSGPETAGLVNHLRRAAGPVAVLAAVVPGHRCAVAGVRRADLRVVG